MLELPLDLLCYTELQGVHLAKNVSGHISEASIQSQAGLDPESLCVCQGSLTISKFLFLMICKQVTSADVWLLNVSDPADVLLGWHSFIKCQMLPMSASAHSCANYSIRRPGFQPSEIITGMTLTTGAVMDVSPLRRVIFSKGNSKKTIQSLETISFANKKGQAQILFCRIFLVYNADETSFSDHVKVKNVLHLPYDSTEPLQPETGFIFIPTLTVSIPLS